METNQIQDIVFERIKDSNGNNTNYGYGQYGEFRVLMMLSNGYINATKLCQLENKKFNDWSRLNQSNQLINELISVTGIPASEIMIKIQGGNNQGNDLIRGTYCHPKLIPHIASWISPIFAIKVSEIVNNYLMKEYKYQIRQKDDKIDELNKKIDDILRETREARLDLRETRLGLNEATTELRETRIKLTETNCELSQTRTKLTETNDELSLTRTKIDELNRNISKITKNIKNLSLNSIYQEDQDNLINENAIMIMQLDNSGQNNKIFRATLKSLTYMKYYLRQIYPDMNEDNIVYIPHTGNKQLFFDKIKTQLSDYVQDKRRNIYRCNIRDLKRMIILILNGYNKDLYTQITDNNDMDILVKNDLLVNTNGKIKKQQRQQLNEQEIQQLQQDNPNDDDFDQSFIDNEQQLLDDIDSGKINININITNIQQANTIINQQQANNIANIQFTKQQQQFIRQCRKNYNQMKDYIDNFDLQKEIDEFNKIYNRNKI